MSQDDDFFRGFGERLRGERARRGMSRKLLADHAGISERYVTQIETGKGNVSIGILRQLAAALGVPLGKLVADEAPSAELSLLNEFVARLSPAQLREAYDTLAKKSASRADRIALIGLRGAGKSTLGAALAKARNVPFFELDREIERLSGTSLGTLIDMYGQQVYRRYELQALQDLLDTHPKFVVAAGGGIVSEAATYELLLRHCFTVWVRTTPEEHMARVIAQGDRRPMAGSAQAMEDLRRILEERTPLYERADRTVDTTGMSVEEAVGIIMPDFGLRTSAP
ncbi:MAG TPA: helix-turn-helix transcriptional regulator [Thermoanaerobaculia bacterium]|nr:helix-turn-helix transcriptional regulator [Thermoanaerobaculia bacterium]